MHIRNVFKKKKRGRKGRSGAYGGRVYRVDFEVWRKTHGKGKGKRKEEGGEGGGSVFLGGGEPLIRGGKGREEREKLPPVEIGSHFVLLLGGEREGESTGMGRKRGGEKRGKKGKKDRRSRAYSVGFVSGHLVGKSP